MSSTAFKEEALKMSPDERAKLAEILMDSLDPVVSEVESAWEKESLDRLEAFHRGELDAVDGDELMRKMRRKVD